MKIHEAIEYVLSRPNDDLWLRPIGWKTDAVRILGDKLVFSPGGDERDCVHAYVSEMRGEWEVVTPEQVLNEEAEHNKQTREKVK